MCTSNSSMLTLHKAITKRRLKVRAHPTCQLEDHFSFSISIEAKLHRAFATVTISPRPPNVLPSKSSHLLLANYLRWTKHQSTIQGCGRGHESWRTRDISVLWFGSQKLNTFQGRKEDWVSWLDLQHALYLVTSSCHFVLPNRNDIT